MAVRAKYKVNDIVEFTFAGSPHIGKIYEVGKQSNDVKYSAIDRDGFKYPFSQKNVIGKV